MFAPAAISQAVLNGFECPISLEVMEDPVMATDGHTYERSAIEAYFRSGQNRSPITREPFANRNLIPNIALKKAIADWQRQKMPPAASAAAVGVEAQMKLAQRVAKKEPLRRQEAEVRLQQVLLVQPVPLPRVAVMLPPLRVLMMAPVVRTPMPWIGEYREGGVVFYVDSLQRRALVAAVKDVGIYKWGPTEEDTEIEDEELFAGLENTRRLIRLGRRYEAAVAASFYNGGGYRDWYLPSIEELEEMEEQREIIDAQAMRHGGELFPSALALAPVPVPAPVPAPAVSEIHPNRMIHLNHNNSARHIYWSSSECSDGNGSSYYLSFVNGNWSGRYGRDDACSVRPVRAFSY